MPVEVRSSEGLGLTACLRLTSELLSNANENPFGTPDVAKSVEVLVVDHLVDDGCAKLAEPDEGVVYVLDGEHDAQVPQRVDRCLAVIGCNRGGVEARQL